MDNRAIARQLLDIAHSLERQHASLYRIRAYRQAAETVLGLDEPIDRFEHKTLRDLPGIGRKMSVKIESLLRSGCRNPTQAPP